MERRSSIRLILALSKIGASLLGESTGSETGILLIYENEKKGAGALNVPCNGDSFKKIVFVGPTEESCIIWRGAEVVKGIFTQTKSMNWEVEEIRIRRDWQFK